MKTMKEHYPHFPHYASELSAYIFSADTFVISLKSGSIIRHVADDAPAFIAWLKHHNIRNVKDEIGSLAYKGYFGK